MMNKMFAGQRKITILGLALAVLYLLLAGAATQILHFSRALDEGYHLELVTFIKEKGRLPITFEERAQMARADLPPLYHVLVAAVSGGADISDGPDFKYFWESYRYRVADSQLDRPFSLPTEDTSPPYLGRFWVWQAGRWLSVGLSLAALLVIFLTLLEFPLPARPLAALAGAALIGFTPRYLIVGSALNDDSLLALVAAVYFWALVKAVKSPARLWPWLALGAALGISATVKYSLALMPLEIALIFGVVAWRQKLGAGWLLKRLALVVMLAVLFSSWWFGWNIWHLNTVAEDGLLTGVSRALFSGGYNATLNQIGSTVGGAELVSPATTSPPETLSQWVTVTFTSFWGYGIGPQIPLSPYVFWLIGGLLLAAVAGLVRAWRSNADTRRWIALAAIHVLLLVVLPWFRFETSGRIGQTAQGRHILIPAATAFAALLVWGLAALVPRRRLGSLFGVLVAGLLAWTGIHLMQLPTADPPPLPLRTIPQAAGWLAHPASVQFGENIELVSFEIDPQPQTGRLNLSLGWRALANGRENDRLRVALLNSGGETVSLWTGYSGGGRIPTLAWDAGDSVFDRLALPLPNLPPGENRVQVQLLDPFDQPLPVTPEGGAATDAFALPPFLLAEAVVFAWPAKTDTMRWAAWSANGPVNPAETVFRYPGTISVVTDGAAKVSLVGPDGQGWPPAEAGNGVSNFVIGPRWQSGQYRVQIDGQPADPPLAVENWQPRRFDIPAEMESPLAANFADQVHLLGYSLPQGAVTAGDAFPITLYWQAPVDKSPQANFIQFNNLLGPDGRLHGGYERRPLEYYSTQLWAPGEVVVDGYAVPVDTDAPPGQYWLDVGFYLTMGKAAINLPLVENGKMTDVSSVTIGPIEVTAP